MAPTQVIAQVLSSNKVEIPRSELDFGGRFWIEHLPTGAFYRHFTGDPAFSDDIPAYFVDAAGMPVLLRPLDRPGSRAELEEMRAAREQRRVDQEALAKQRRAELRAATRT